MKAVTDSASGSEWREAGAFATTHWTVVMAAGGDDTRGGDALEELCRVYWRPLYAYARR